MTSSIGNIFRVTGHLCGEFTGDSPHKGQWHGALMFSLICVWINGWVNSREAGDLRRYGAHYDVIVMWYYRLVILNTPSANLQLYENSFGNSQSLMKHPSAPGNLLTQILSVFVLKEFSQEGVAGVGAIWWLWLYDVVGRGECGPWRIPSKMA